MNRFDHLHKQYREARVKARKNAILARSRVNVDTNAGGTSGYTVKHGANTGLVLNHITVSKRTI
jgi:hypothetical protein